MKRILTTSLILSCLSLPLMAEPHHFDAQSLTGVTQNSDVLIGNGFIGGPLEHTQHPWLFSKEKAYISKAQAIDIARNRTNGKVLSANLVQKNQHAFYKVKVLTDSGRIKTLRINAQAR